MSNVKTVTFEDGYERLQTIAERVNSEEVPVDELCDLFAEGKGLEKALSDYLAEQKERVEQIERGEGVQTFKVEAPEVAASEAEAIAAPVEEEEVEEAA
jgi:exodeoxyribonuclease VII small subunit